MNAAANFLRGLSGRRSETPPLFAWLGVLYLLIISATALNRSIERSSIFSGLGRSGGSDADGSGTRADLSAEDASRLRLQDFRRIEVRRGRTAWDITADSATYFEVERTTLLRSPVMVVYREDGSVAKVSAQAAQLIATGPTVNQARLEGQVVVVSDDQTRVQTDLAVFDAKRNVIEAPGLVKISGPGYEVLGKRMTLTLEQDTIQLGESVRTRFQSGAKPPRRIVKATSK